MTPSPWKSGWQENAFQRCQPHIAAVPGLFQRITPADAVEDAYLLGLASTLFLRDDMAAAPPARGMPHPPSAPREGQELQLPPFGLPPFSYERALSAPPETAAAYGAALAGQCGAFHREAARRAGSPAAWGQALGQLYRQQALLPGCPADPRAHAPALPPLAEELQGCAQAVLRKAIHALKIGFGLWGRWEAA